MPPMHRRNESQRSDRRTRTAPTVTHKGRALSVLSKTTMGIEIFASWRGIDAADAQAQRESAFRSENADGSDRHAQRSSTISSKQNHYGNRNLCQLEGDRCRRCTGATRVSVPIGKRGRLRPSRTKVEHYQF